MDHAISIDGSVTRAMPDERIEALKARYVRAPDHQQQLEDGDLNQIMDCYLYEATKEGDVEKFIHTLEKVSESRKLALSLIFDQVTPSGNSLLHVAASSGNDDVMELILIHFPNTLTRKNSLEETPLHVAVQEGRINATKKLIHLETDSEIIYWKNKNSKSPLYLAAETGDMTILGLLLEAYARDEAYAAKIQGMSPFAALKDRKSGIWKEIIDKLPKLLNLKGEDGGTPLHSAASVGNVEAVQFLLSKCSYLALQTDNNGSYPIHIACEHGHVETTQVLVKMWPDLAEIKNKKGQNILHVAAKGGNKRVVRHILNKCGQPNVEKLVNSQDIDGNTPLHLASMHNHWRVLGSLTKNKRINLQLLNNDNLTALDVAMEPQSFRMNDPALRGGEILIKAGVPQSKVRDLRSPKEQSPGASEPYHAKWVQDEINTRLVVATLVISVTFAAGFTLPGGYNQSDDGNPGVATMLDHGVFKLFVISDTLAMYNAILAVVTLLRGHGSNIHRTAKAHHHAGGCLYRAFISMAVAFLAALIVSLGKLSWLTMLVLFIAVIYILNLLFYVSSLISTGHNF
ncbi:protein ACCELERATED CELL DEATH 6-like [Eucalyptus grandis]|uniref:protein ACCELERATED CELL DEATH 6-like n=1 Tax=Eucalyptus grandis TaxID=71139 RepID=UPI00192E963C|nr:protein ACCELERATED CELL DEATH 6-like [Eucalyptus grandis]